MKPMKLIVGAFTYKVKRVAYLPNEKGCAYVEEGAIQYGKDQDRLHQRETVLHELLHCIIDQCADRNREAKENEATITSISPLLFQTLRDNPKLVEFLLG